ncbi:MAG: hypothetical protein RLY70_936 [Planctomycetota bacterium]|jgi:hypothetical protein
MYAFAIGFRDVGEQVPGRRPLPRPAWFGS